MDPFVDLTGKAALVTGGSRGIGAQIVRDLAERGARVAFNYNSSPDQARALVAEIGADRATALQADLSDWQAVDRLWDEAVAWAGGRIDVLVNNASIRTPADDDDRAQWHEAWMHTLQVNLVATAQLSRSAVAHYREHGGGIIVSITGRIAVRGDYPGFFQDGAAKGGMNSLMRGLARWHAKEGLQTFLVCPGIIETDQAREHFDIVGREQPMAEIPMGEFGKPSDISTIVTFLASGRARYASGSTIDVTGASFLH